LLVVTSIEFKVASVIIHFSFERGFPKKFTYFVFFSVELVI